MRSEDQAAHRWYRFVLAFPPHLVRHCVEQAGPHTADVIADPFAGTGTTIVEASKLGFGAAGVEAAPMARAATAAKIDWSPPPDRFAAEADRLAAEAARQLDQMGTPDEPGNGGGAQPKPAGLLDLPDDARLDKIVVATIGHLEGPLENIPPATGIENRVELRLNNALLEPVSVDGAWLVFQASPAQLAPGENLVGVRLSDHDAEAPGRVWVEKLEIHVKSGS